MTCCWPNGAKNESTRVATAKTSKKTRGCCIGGQDKSDFVLYQQDSFKCAAFQNNFFPVPICDSECIIFHDIDAHPFRHSQQEHISNTRALLSSSNQDGPLGAYIYFNLIGGGGSFGFSNLLSRGISWMYHNCTR